MSKSIHLTESMQRALGALGHSSGRAGKRTGVGEDEVLVLVVGAHGALVSRTRTSGRVASLRDLKLRLAGAEAAVTSLSAASVAEQAAQLTEAEASVLDRAGLLETKSTEPGALERSRIELELLLRDSLTLGQAAKLLQVGTSRLRQRLGSKPSTLYGFKEGRGWRIPRFQLAGKGKLVRGIEKVFPHIRAEAHLLSVATWFSAQHPDLVVGDDEKPVSPLEWLSAGLSPELVAQLAEDI